MDADVARTLGELEHKLNELERTLSALSREGLQPSGGLHPSDSRETGAAPPAETPLAETDRRTAAPPPSVGWSRIVDETIEVTSAGAPAAPPAPRVSRPAWLQPLPAQAPPQIHRQTPLQSPRAPHPPSPAELLRFRERLEQTARDLAHDYDQLLGRLSYAAVPMNEIPTRPTISFARGAPSLDIVDVDGLRDAAVRAFESDPAGTTAYGTSIGYPRLRSWIADRHGVEPERVLVTNGSMQADAFLFEQLVREGDEVIVERPTYDRTLLSLRSRGARVHAVELQPDGINTNALAELLTAGPSAARPTLAHIIPNFQNPAGYTLSYEKRRRLLELAADHSFMVFEDDPYVELRFSGETLPTMLSMDPERVVYASSFSKTVCPGIRVGYLVGPPDLIGAIAQLATNTYISPNMVAQSIVYEFCASGAIERSIETVKAALAERAQALANALRSELADAEFEIPQGGYFMWVTLPEGTDVGALFKAAADRGVAFVKGTDFLLEGGENTLRLAYSGVTPEQIDVGVARLAEAYRSL
ncbi:MAG TPA: PLP-dependent aminotransferase family protein [Solirubrobacteraceae bacterium]|nr:PLP-dependent aminotransferase family protein [Solirubrobacteraceae bacterium]